MKQMGQRAIECIHMSRGRGLWAMFDMTATWSCPDQNGEWWLGRNGVLLLLLILHDDDDCMQIVIFIMFFLNIIESLNYKQDVISYLHILLICYKSFDKK